MKKFFYITSILSIIFISIASMSYLQFKIYSLQHKNAILQKENNNLEQNMEELHKKVEGFNNQNNYDKKEKLVPNDKFSPDNVFDDLPKDFGDIDKNLQDMEKTFSQPTFQFKEKSGNTP